MIYTVQRSRATALPWKQLSRLIAKRSSPYNSVVFPRQFIFLAKSPRRQYPLLGSHCHPPIRTPLVSPGAPHVRRNTPPQAWQTASWTSHRSHISVCSPPSRLRTTTFTVFGLLVGIMMVGVVVNAAILIVDERTIHLARGMTPHAATLKASVAKFRRILMSSAASLF